MRLFLGVLVTNLVLGPSPGPVPGPRVGSL